MSKKEIWIDGDYITEKIFGRALVVIDKWEYDLEADCLRLTIFCDDDGVKYLEKKYNKREGKPVVGFRYE